MAKRGRNPKSDVVAADEPQKEDIFEREPDPEQSETEPDPLQESLPAVVVPNLPSESLFDEPTVPPQVAVDDIPHPDEGLTPAQKQEFVRLVRREMPLEERAKQLALLARLKGTKTAAVGLRAIMEMNRLDGFTDDAAADVPPMFAIPEGSNVAIAVKVPSK